MTESNTLNTVSGLESNRDFFRNEKAMLESVQDELCEDLIHANSQFEEITQTSRGCDGAFYDRVFGSVQETNSSLHTTFDDLTDTISSDVRTCDVKIEDAFEQQRQQYLKEKAEGEEGTHGGDEDAENSAVGTSDASLK